MSTLTIVLLVILVVLIAALIALYFFGKKAFSKDYSTNKDTCKMPERIISQAFLFSL